MLLGRVLGLLSWLLVVGWSGIAAAQPKVEQRTIGFSKLVFRLDGGDSVGIAGEDFRVHILDELRRRGLNAVGAENLVFGGDRGGSADLVLGGTINEMECVAGSSAQRSTCRMGIEWQVLDAASDRVVYRLQSRGLVKDAAKEPAVTLGKQLVAANLDSLARRPQFKGLLAPSPQRALQPYQPWSLRACRAAARSMPGASEQVLDATVLIKTREGFGSGFVLGPEGFVVTAAHVVTEAGATVRLRGGREVPATLVRVDRGVDIALLRLALPEGTLLPCLPALRSALPIGADVYAIGSPARPELSFSLARGIVSGVRSMDGVQFLQTDAAINPGNSGGPLVSASGEAAAVVSFKLVGNALEGLAFGLPLGTGLQALAVTPVDGFTSPELVAAGPVPAAPTPALIQDTPDAVPAFGPIPDSGVKDTRVQGTRPRMVSTRFKTVLYTLGGSALLGGLLVVAMHNSSDVFKGSSDGPWWGLAAGGAVLVGVGVALP